MAKAVIPQQVARWYIALCALFLIHMLHSFDSLDEMSRYISTLQEYPDSNKQLWNNPNYSNYHKTIAPSFFERIAIHCGLLRPLWSFDTFVKHLDKNISLPAAPQNVLHITIDSEKTVQLIIVGDLFGSLFSLTRICQHLHTKGILDERLNIIKPDTYIIFLGNLVGASPYCLETLTILFILREQNPDTVFLLCGLNEHCKRWYTESLFWEMQGRSRLRTEKLRTTNAQLNDFFNSLPRALLITLQQTQEVILCTSADALNELKDTTNKRCPTPFSTAVAHYCSGAPSLIFATKSSFDTVFPLEALTFIPPLATSPATWTLVSGQTRTTRQVFRASSEGYISVTIVHSLSTSPLELHSRSVYKTDPISLQGRYALLTGDKIPFE